jgi:hypothetical protein
MMPYSPRVLLVAVTALALTAMALVVREAVAARESEGARQFQRLVGGLGFGPAVDLSRSSNSFDPRLSPGCSIAEGPIPGGGWVAQRRGFSVFWYPPLRPGDFPP